MTGLAEENDGLKDCRKGNERCGFGIPVADANLAKNVLSLPPTERAELASLLIDSLKGSTRSDEEIKLMLRERAEALRSGGDAGLSFEEIFGEPLREWSSSPELK